MNSRKRVATLVSGGQDSTVLAYWAKNQGYEQHLFLVNYGQDNYEKELECVRINATRINSALEIIDIPGLRKSFLGLIPRPLNLNDSDSAQPYGQVITYSFTGIVATIALLLGIETLFIGIHGDDLERMPAVRKAIRNLEEMINFIIQDRIKLKVQVQLPFEGKNKSDVTKLGVELGVPFEYTWSCNENGDKPCCACDSCLRRLKAFEKAGYSDPLVDKQSVPQAVNTY